MPVFIEYPNSDSLVNIREIVGVERRAMTVVLHLSDGRWIVGRYDSEELAAEGLNDVRETIRMAAIRGQGRLTVPWLAEGGARDGLEVKYRKIADIPDLRRSGSGDWIDLYTAETSQLEKGDFMKIRLGVAMELPRGHEAVIVPRSSTFEKYGLLQTNGMGVIDESYKGDGDEWSFPCYATRDVLIPRHTRLCQFRILKHQPMLMFSEVWHLGNADRGGYGTTGD